MSLRVKKVSTHLNDVNKVATWSINGSEDELEEEENVSGYETEIIDEEKERADYRRSRRGNL